MSGSKQIGVLVFALLLSPFTLLAQSPLRVEVLTETNWNWELITVKITNVSLDVVELAVPVNYSFKSRERTVNPLPMDVELHDGQNWFPSRPGGDVSPWQDPAPELIPGQIIRFKFAVAGGPGEYRARVWFILTHGDSGPPWHPPEFSSAFSNTFKVISISQAPAASLAERPLHLCGTIVLSR